MKYALIYKIFILGIFVLLFLPFLGYAQVIFEGQVLSKATELPIADVNVRLIKENLTTSTNAQGYFRLSTENASSNDTLFFSYVGYLDQAIPVSQYQKNIFIVLTPANAVLDEVHITNEKLKVVKLNKFDLGDIKESPEYRTLPVHPVGLILAKLFTAPQGNVILADIELGRREIDVTRFPERPIVTAHGNTRFLLHVMSVDPKTRVPGDVLYTKTVNLTDKTLWVKIDLTKDNIVITPAEFYVAIEWLPIPYNEVIKLNYAPKVRKINKKGMQLLDDVSSYDIHYEPALVEYARKKPAMLWIKNKQKWKRRDSKDFRPERDVAISATIHY